VFSRHHTQVQSARGGYCTQPYPRRRVAFRVVRVLNPGKRSLSQHLGFWDRWDGDVSQRRVYCNGTPWRDVFSTDHYTFHRLFQCNGWVHEYGFLLQTKLAHPALHGGVYRLRAYMVHSAASVLWSNVIRPLSLLQQLNVACVLYNLQQHECCDWCLSYWLAGLRLRWR